MTKTDLVVTIDQIIDVAYLEVVDLRKVKYGTAEKCIQSDLRLYTVKITATFRTDIKRLQDMDDFTNYVEDLCDEIPERWGNLVYLSGDNFKFFSHVNTMLWATFFYEDVYPRENAEYKINAVLKKHIGKWLREEVEKEVSVKISVKLL